MWGAERGVSRKREGGWRGWPGCHRVWGTVGPGGRSPASTETSRGGTATPGAASLRPVGYLGPEVGSCRSPAQQLFVCPPPAPRSGRDCSKRGTPPEHQTPLSNLGPNPPLQRLRGSGEGKHGAPPAPPRSACAAQRQGWRGPRSAPRFITPPVAPPEPLS